MELVNEESVSTKLWTSQLPLHSHGQPPWECDVTALRGAPSHQSGFSMPLLFQFKDGKSSPRIGMSAWLGNVICWVSYNRDTKWPLALPDAYNGELPQDIKLVHILVQAWPLHHHHRHVGWNFALPTSTCLQPCLPGGMSVKELRDVDGLVVKWRITSSGFSISRHLEPIVSSGKWDDIFKILKENNCQLRILYLAKLPLETTKAGGAHNH